MALHHNPTQSSYASGAAARSRAAMTSAESRPVSPNMERRMSTSGLACEFQALLVDRVGDVGTTLC